MLTKGSPTSLRKDWILGKMKKSLGGKESLGMGTPSNLRAIRY